MASSLISMPERSSDLAESGPTPGATLVRPANVSRHRRRMPKRTVRPCAARCRANLGDLLRDLCGRLAPGEIAIDMFGCDVDSGIRRAAEIERGVRLLDGREVDLGDTQVFTDPGCLASRKHLAPDAEEVVGDLVALIVRDEDAIGSGFRGIAASDNVDEEPAIGEPIEGGGHARCNARWHSSMYLRFIKRSPRLNLGRCSLTRVHGSFR